MNRINEFKPCPMCGKTNRMELTKKQFYHKLKQKYGSAMIEVRCWECNLTLSVYPHIENTNNYEILVARLKEKWNGIKR